MHFYVATILCGGRRREKTYAAWQKEVDDNLLSRTHRFSIYAGRGLWRRCPTGTTASQTDKASADKQIYVSALNVQNFKTFDPGAVTDAASGYAIQMLFTGLVELDTKGNIIPVIAKSWVPSDGGKTWTFTLRDDAKFNDGTAITSTDVAFSLNRALDPATKSPFALGYMGLIPIAISSRTPSRASRP